MEKYTYDDVYEATLKYFDGDELATNVFISKYCLRDNNNYLEKTPDDMHHRIAKEFSRIERSKYKNTKIKPLSELDVYNLIKDFKYIIPQGSPMFGIGNDYQIISLSNCFVIESPEDSYSAIMKADEEIVQISKRRGGVGLDISNLRPAGSLTKNAAKTSTGIIPFMERFSNSIREVGQEGRRGALMISLSVHHYQVEDFATAKKDLTKITGANISIRLTDEFMNAVKNDELYEQRFPVDYKEQGIEPKMTRMVPAKQVWNTIVTMAHATAEPGLLFWDNIIENSPADSYSDVGFQTVSTNPCSEIGLCPGDSCRLLAINLFGFVDHPFTNNAKFNFIKFYEYTQYAQRLMDDLVDLEIEKLDSIIKKIESDPENEFIKYRELSLWKKMKEMAIKGRRTGLGITALGDTIASLNIKYGSDESVSLTGKIYKTIRNGAYASSVDMAEAIGSFPIFNFEKEKNNKYLLRLKDEFPELYEKMKIYGRRNIALLTTAPTGSISLEAKTSSGIEPVFMLEYTRRRKLDSDSKDKPDFIDDNGDKWKNYKVYHPNVKLWMKITGNDNIEESPWYDCTAEKIDWKNRVRLQGLAQKYICHSISSTINLPEEITVEEVKEIYENAWTQGCKGITIYRSGSRTGVLVDDKKEDTILFKQNKAPKRPKELPANIHHLSYKGEPYYVVVGLWENKPYEVFVGKNHDVNNENYFVPKRIKHGIVKKIKRGHYVLINGDGIEYPLSGELYDDVLESMTRLVSLSLRHGTNIGFIVQNLEKTKGDFYGFSKILSRTLKKYIIDGEIVEGENCPSCNNVSLIREDGCVRCHECGWTRCS